MSYVGGAGAGTANAGAGLTVNYSPTPGNAVVIGFQVASGNAFSSLSDSGGHTYTNGVDMTLLGNFDAGAGSARSWVAVIPNIGSGITSFTFGGQANVGRSMHIGEYSGRDTALATIIDTSAHASDAATAATSLPGSTAQITPTATGCDIVMFTAFAASVTATTGGASGGGTWTAGPTATSRASAFHVDNVGTSTYSAAESWTTSANWVVQTVALAPAAGGGPATETGAFEAKIGARASMLNTGGVIVSGTMAAKVGARATTQAALRVIGTVLGGMGARASLRNTAGAPIQGGIDGARIGIRATNQGQLVITGAVLNGRIGTRARTYRPAVVVLGSARHGTTLLIGVG